MASRAVKGGALGVGGGALAGAAIGAVAGPLGALAGAGIGALVFGVQGAEIGFGLDKGREDEMNAFWERRKKIVRQFEQEGATPEEIRAFSLQANLLDWEEMNELNVIAQTELGVIRGRVGAARLQAGVMLENQRSLLEDLSTSQQVLG